MINVHCTLILILDYIEKQFSAISDFGVRENFPLILYTITYCWFGRKHQMFQKI